MVASLLMITSSGLGCANWSLQVWAQSTAPTSGAAGCDKCYDLEIRFLLCRLALVLSRLALVLGGLSLSCLVSWLTEAHLPSRRYGERGGRERHDKAKGQCRHKRLHLSSPSAGCRIAPIRGTLRAIY